MYFKKRANKLRLTLEGKNAVTGYLFLLPFVIGFLAFMLYPIAQSFAMVFSNVRIDLVNHGLKLEFVGIDNLRQAFLVDVEFTRYLTEDVLKMVVRVPAVLIFSLFVALLLDQKFKGRGLARAIFFLPVILSSGAMMNMEVNNSLLNSVSDTIRDQNVMKTSVSAVLQDIILSSGLMVGSGFFTYIFDIVDQIYVIVMSAGIQIVIFLSGLQTISSSVYEAAQIEGATKWECFWKITFPMISPLILVNLVYSVVDFFDDNSLLGKINNNMNLMAYGYSSAMAWVYFAIIAALLGIVYLIVRRGIYYYD